MGTPSTQVWSQPRNVGKSPQGNLHSIFLPFFTQLVGCERGSPCLGGPVESIPNIHKNNFKTCLNVGLSFLPVSLSLHPHSWFLGQPRTGLHSAFRTQTKISPDILVLLLPQVALQQQTGSSQPPCPHTTSLSVSDEIIYNLVETIFWLQVIFK